MLLRAMRSVSSKRPSSSIPGPRPPVPATAAAISTAAFFGGVPAPRATRADCATCSRLRTSISCSEMLSSLPRFPARATSSLHAFVLDEEMREIVQAVGALQDEVPVVDQLGREIRLAER